MIYDFDSSDIADEVIRNIENEYGRSIARIPYFERASEPYSFDIKIIFSDFKLLEGKIEVMPFIGHMAQVRVSGTYY
jgi:hypothetical protein